MLIPANTSEAQERSRQLMLTLRSPSVNVTTRDTLMPLPPSLPGGRGLFSLIPVITDVSVAISINTAGMLTSPQLESISRRRSPGRSSRDPPPSDMLQRRASRDWRPDAARRRRRRCSVASPGFHKTKSFNSKNCFYAGVKLHVRSLGPRLISASAPPADDPPSPGVNHPLKGCS